MTRKNMTRRDFLRLSAAATAGLAFANTGLRRRVFAAPSKQSDSITVYWHPAHAYDAYAAIIEQFTEDTGVGVNWEMFQWPDMRTKILTDFAASEVPDLVEEPGGWVQEFAQAGNLLSLESFIEQDGVAMGFPNDWQPNTIGRNAVDSQLYGIQLHYTCVLLFYNVDMLADAGVEPPTNWEEFLMVAQATTKDRVFGFAPNQSASDAWPWLLQNNVRYYDPETNTIPMDTPDAHEALQFLTDLIHEHEVAPVPIAAADYEGPQKLFSAERAAMIFTGPWDIRPILEGSPNLNWDIAQMLTRKTQATQAGGTSMMIPKNARNPEMAWELLKRLVTLDAEIAATNEANMLMPRISWANDPAIKDLPRIAPFGQGLSYAQDVTAELRLTGKYGEIDQLFRLAYEQSIFGNRSAEESLGEFVEQANAILADD